MTRVEGYMNYTGSTANAFPSDGVGGLTTSHSASTAADTTYTATTAVDANVGPWTFAGTFAAIVAGDFIGTTGGFWGIVQSTTAPGTVTVDYWRSPLARPAQAGPNKGIPAAGTGAIVHTKNQYQGAQMWRLVRILPTKVTATNTLAIINPGGTAQITFTVPGTPQLIAIECDILFPFPFGVKGSATDSTYLILYATE